MMKDAGHGGELVSEHFYQANEDIPEDLRARGFLDYCWFASSPYAVLALAKRGGADDWGAYLAGVRADTNLDAAMRIAWGSACKLDERLAVALFPLLADSGLRYRP